MTAKLLLFLNMRSPFFLRTLSAHFSKWDKVVWSSKYYYQRCKAYYACSAPLLRNIWCPTILKRIQRYLQLTESFKTFFIHWSYFNEGWFAGNVFVSPATVFLALLQDTPCIAASLHKTYTFLAIWQLFSEKQKRQNSEKETLVLCVLGMPCTRAERSSAQCQYFLKATNKAILVYPLHKISVIIWPHSISKDGCFVSK